MPKSQYIIDFEIIWKKFNLTISEEEEKQLNEWLDESPQHRHFFENVRSYYSKGSQFADIPSETDKAWLVVRSHINSIKRSVVRWSLVGSGIAASLLVVALLLYQMPGNQQLPSQIAQVESPIKPGSNKATLILDNGSAYDLSGKSTLVLAEGNSTIKSSGDKLEYTESKAVPAEVKYNTLKIPRGGEFFLKLSDGTSVWLNSETTLRYPVQFQGQERRVELTGEAFFEVTKNAEMPFVVTSGAQEVKVLGTQFNVSSYDENAQIITTLVEGKVEVFAKGHPENSKVLSPNEQSLFSKGDSFISLRQVDPEIFVSWKDGRFMFADAALSDIMSTLSRWYDVQVIYQNEQKKNFRFTGNLQRYADIREMLQKMEKTDEVKFEIENNTIMVR